MAIVPNGGKKSPYVERLKRQQKAAAIKFYVLAIILGALIGTAYIKRVELVAVYNSVVNPSVVPEPAPVAPPTAPPEPKPAEVVPPIEAPKTIPDAIPVSPKPPANVAIEPSISAQDEAKARQFLDDGKTCLDSFDFDGASKRFELASKLNIGMALKNETKVWMKKAVSFQNATKHIAISDYALSENAVLIETTQGDEFRGIKLKANDEILYLQQINDANPAAEGIQKFPIPVNEIKKIKPITLAQRRADFIDRVLSLEGGTTISHSTDYYDLVYLCKRFGLGKECMMYLNRAFDGGPGHAADPNVGDTFRNVVVRRVISRATLLIAGNRRVQVNDELKKLSDLFPDYAGARYEIASFRSQVMDKVRADFQPSMVVNTPKIDPRKAQSVAAGDKSIPRQLAREDRIEFGVDKVMSTGAAGKILERANAKFEEGMSVVRKYTVGVGGNKEDNNRILLSAKRELSEAIDIYEEALKLEPSNRAIKDREQTANQMVYFCNKNIIL